MLFMILTFCCGLEHCSLLNLQHLSQSSMLMKLCRSCFTFLLICLCLWSGSITVECQELLGQLLTIKEVFIWVGHICHILSQNALHTKFDTGSRYGSWHLYVKIALQPSQ